MNSGEYKEAVRILVVDDDEMSAELLETKLSLLGYEVTTASSAEEGIAVDRELLPHLILLDVVLPEMSGFEACQKLIENHGNRYVPIILVTGMDDVNAKIRGLECGAYGYVTKPYDAQELLARVRSALRTKKLYDELKETREKLIEAEQLAALGHMAITLHHEINNPLQAIVLLAENVLHDIDSDSDEVSKEDVDTILRSCSRIQDVLKKIVNLKRVRSAPYVGGIDMIDLDEST